MGETDQSGARTPCSVSGSDPVATENVRGFVAITPSCTGAAPLRGQGRVARAGSCCALRDLRHLCPELRTSVPVNGSPARSPPVERTPHRGAATASRFPRPGSKIPTSVLRKRVDCIPGHHGRDHVARGGLRARHSAGTRAGAALPDHIAAPCASPTGSQDKTASAWRGQRLAVVPPPWRLDGRSASVAGTNACMRFCCGGRGSLCPSDRRRSVAALTPTPRRVSSDGRQPWIGSWQPTGSVDMTSWWWSRARTTGRGSTSWLTAFRVTRSSMPLPRRRTWTGPCRCACGTDGAAWKRSRGSSCLVWR